MRYGDDPGETRTRIDLAMDLVRSFLPNGAAAANQLRERVAAASGEVPADIIVEVVAKMAWKGHLFEAARDFDRAAHHRDLPPFAALSTDARSFAGAVLDFSGVNRTAFASASEAAGQTRPAKSEPASDAGPPIARSLFDTDRSGS